MAKREPKSLFKRLSGLFRSGPIVKRKVRNVDTAIASPDKSSGTLLFQKSSTPAFSTMTGNAYNLSERLMRYQDFCFGAETLVYTLNGVFTIGELARMYPNGERFLVYSYDYEKRRPTIGTAFLPRSANGGRPVPRVRLTFDDGGHVDLTPDHRMLLRDGSTRQVKDLLVGDSLMPLYVRELGSGYNVINLLDSRRSGGGAWIAEHKFVAENVYGALSGDQVVHHVDFNKRNNHPSNLAIMERCDHSALHAGLNNENKLGRPNEKHSRWMRLNGSRDRSVTFELIVDTCNVLGTLNCRSVQEALSIDANALKLRLRERGFRNWVDFRERFGEAQAIATHGTIARETRSPSYYDILELAPWCQSLDELANRLSCTRQAINRRLGAYGIEGWTHLKTGLPYRGRKRGPKSDGPTYQQVCNAYERGMTLEQLASACGTTRNKVSTCLRNDGHVSFVEWSRTHLNHKVGHIEALDDDVVYTITVEKYHNLAVGSKNPSPASGKSTRPYSMCFATNCEMEYTPEIAAALDLFADETCAQDDKGRVLHVYSENERIKETLEDLFYNSLNAEFNLRPWTRNLGKYGDLFLYIDVSPEFGVVNAFPIPVNEIEREENFDRNDPFAVRFRWVSAGNRVLENWEIAHFRLLGNDMFLPYGSSLIEAARRIWRQLILMEDSMLVYRVVRAPERRVFYIDVGNLPPENVPMYIEEQKRNLRSSMVVDNTTGRVDLRYSPLPLRKDTNVLLLDGRTIELIDLAAEHESGKENWVYSVQKGTNRVVPGKVVWCGKNYTCDRIHRVWLDDGSYIDAAPEHPFVMSDGEGRRADELVPGDSLMPLYTRLSSEESGDKISGYPMFKENVDGKWVYTHRWSARELLNEQRKEVMRSTDWSKNKNIVVHHRDFNKRNASPCNLQWMGNADHYSYHALLGRENLIRYNKSPEHRRTTAEVNRRLGKAQRMGEAYNGSELHKQHNVNRREAQLASWSSYADQRKQGMRWIIPNDVVAAVFGMLKANGSLGREELTGLIRRDAGIMRSLADANACNNRDVTKFHIGSIIQKLERMKLPNFRSGYRGFREYAAKNPPPSNHQVVRVEVLSEVDDVYCLTVHGPSGEHDRHTVAVQGKGGAQGIVFVKQSLDEDYFLPVRGGDTGTKIDTLAGGQNTAAVEDVAYIQKKLFAALRVPRAYLGYDEMLSSRATLAQEDIRFSRTIGVIQKTLISELNKIAIVHLYANGFDGDDLQNFVIRLSNPSTVAQQQKLELWRAKFEIGGSMPEGMGSKEFVQHEIWGLSPEQIAAIDEQRVRERQLDARIEAEIESTAAVQGGASDELFGGGKGGGSEAGGEPAAEKGGGAGEGEGGGGEEPEDVETAAKEPFDDEDVESSAELLTSAEDRDDDEDYSVRLGDADRERPIKPKSQLDIALYNRSRRRTHGASKTHMPDFVKMTGNDGPAMKDPTDSSWIRSVVSNPFGEVARRVSMSPDVKSTLRSMSTTFERQPRPGTGVLSEGKDVQDKIDAMNVSLDDILDHDIDYVGLVNGDRSNEHDDVEDDDLDRIVIDGQVE